MAVFHSLWLSSIPLYIWTTSFFLVLKNLFIYLFIYFGCARVFSSCGERGLLFVAVVASHCGGFSCCGARALGAWASVVAAHGLSNCGLRARECRLSSCGAWLSCSVACGIFPDQGSNLCPRHWQADS